MRPLGGLLVALLFVVARPASAQTPAQSGPERTRFFIDVNLIGSASTNAAERVFTNSFLQFGEVGTIRVTYPKPKDARVFPILDVGGGLMVNDRIGFGAVFSQTSYDDAAGMLITVPHPYYLQAPGTGTGPSDPLRRTENSTHIFLSVTVLRTPRTEWRFSGGPSIMSYSADMVSAISYSQDATAASQSNIVTITGYTTSEVHGTTIGVHAASDFSYSLTRMMALTGGVRASLGTVTIDEPLSHLEQEIRIGGWRVFAGLRFRFGTLSSK